MKYLFLVPLLITAIACKKETVQQQDITTPSKIRCSPPLTDAEWYTSNTPAPLFEKMDVLKYPITTKSEEAQKYFNQGLLLAYAFNHAGVQR